MEVANPVNRNAEESAQNVQEIVLLKAQKPIPPVDETVDDEAISKDSHDISDQNNVRDKTVVDTVVEGHNVPHDDRGVG